MDTTRIINEPEAEPTEHEIKCARLDILGCLQRYQFVYWKDIYGWSRHSSSVPALRKALNKMIADKEVRQREDELEHDWEYSLKAV